MADAYEAHDPFDYAEEVVDSASARALQRALAAGCFMVVLMIALAETQFLLTLWGLTTLRDWWLVAGIAYVFVVQARTFYRLGRGKGIREHAPDWRPPPPDFGPAKVALRALTYAPSWVLMYLALAQWWPWQVAAGAVLAWAGLWLVMYLRTVRITAAIDSLSNFVTSWRRGEEKNGPEV
jgi:hypothetical protein